MSRSPGEPHTADADVEYVFDRDAVRAVDRAAIEEYGIPGIVLMENAALGLAEVTLHLLDDLETEDPEVLIVCGGGNNGGDGYALARHLHHHGVRVRIVALGEPRTGGDARINFDICRKMGLAIGSFEPEAGLPAADLVVDAIFGTGLDREVTGDAARAIEMINAADAAVLAVDAPSGLDCNTGSPLGTAVRADATVTFVGVKQGFLNLEAQPYVGEVFVAPIGAPAELIARYGRRA